VRHGTTGFGTFLLGMLGFQLLDDERRRCPQLLAKALGEAAKGGVIALREKRLHSSVMAATWGSTIRRVVLVLIAINHWSG
jgi:hypothetical protein